MSFFQISVPPPVVLIIAAESFVIHPLAAAETEDCEDLSRFPASSLSIEVFKTCPLVLMSCVGDTGYCYLWITLLP